MSDPVEQDLGTFWAFGAHFRLLREDPDGDAVEVFFPAGMLTPLHRHGAFAEMLFIISGELDAVVDGRYVRGGEGDLVTVPARTPHVVRAGDDGVHLIAMSRPAGHAAFMKALASGAGEPPDMERVMTESARIGDEILGPPEVALQLLTDASAG